jgi:hypothetical protein
MEAKTILGTFRGSEKTWPEFCNIARQRPGHKTQSMFSRYNISDVDRNRTTLEAAQEFAEAQAALEQAGNMVSMQR